MNTDYLYDLTLEVTANEGQTVTYKMMNLPLGETKATGLYAVAEILISQMYGAIHIGYGTPLWSSTELDCAPLTKALDAAIEAMAHGTDLISNTAEMPNATVSVGLMRHAAGYVPMTKRTDNL